ncbi:PepSY domain-containing protein [Domibacillus epiphyticus]|uniref:PepSY domain-containing protein n=1 Tax=Domibacillus epiphyticus TaxID=1714355 RepID=A0A1V2AC09_9BACI|nr:PepSY domain-containing protein [Domibacillus epiphyticus]OMP68372.1 hypothetical protein BTO28_01760 [Domibacillus epiphyticus]
MKIKIFLIAVIVIGLGFVLYEGLFNNRPAIISQKQAEKIVTDMYGGNIVSVKWDQPKYDYYMVIKNEKGTYSLSVDGKTKKINNVKMMEKEEALLTLEEAKEKIIAESNGRVTEIKAMREQGKQYAEAIVSKEEKQFRVIYDLINEKTVSSKEIKDSPAEKAENVISEQRAREIALKTVNGSVTNVSKINSKTGPLYKVTVENSKDGAHVYIQETTAKLSSIYWFKKVQKESPKTKTNTPPVESDDDDVDDEDTDTDSDDQVDDD